MIFEGSVTSFHLFDLLLCACIQSAVTRNNSDEKLHLKIQVGVVLNSSPFIFL